MRSKYIVLFLSLFAISNVMANSPSIVPKPVKLQQKTGSFDITAIPTISIAQKSLQSEAKLLVTQLQKLTGTRFKLATKGKLGISLSISTEIPKEGYRLTVSPKKIKIIGGDKGGVFYGTQTLVQLLTTGNTKISCVEIEDQPSFPWRGMMLDVSRYFFDKAFVLRYIDIMAMHKMNTLHIHLIDDCGWRIEIKKYPKLTTVGAFRGTGSERYGGFFTQDDIREMVKYAADRHITIVPEINLPAHVLSAIVAYPNLSCSGKQLELPNRHFISHDLYCPGKESTWTFLENVMTEVIALFPSKYVHIGGDEAKYDRWKTCKLCQAKMKELGLKNEHELQGYMNKRIEKFLQKYDRQIIGWDEIMRCGVTKDAGIMTWHRPQTAAQGAKNGNSVVMALTGHCYFDTPESKLPGEIIGAGWLKPISLKLAYEWHPTPAGLNAKDAKNILGGNGCVWTDQFLHTPSLRDSIGSNKPSILYKKHFSHLKSGNAKQRKGSELYVEYFSLPRMAALAEVTWTPKSQRNWDDFERRMKRQYVRYEDAGYHYRLPVPEVKATEVDGGFEMSAECPIEGGTIRYSDDGTPLTANSKQLNGSVKVTNREQFKAISLAPSGKNRSLVFEYGKIATKNKKHGNLIGKWKAGKIGSKKAKIVTFDATGKINRKGNYLITFIYTGGECRLDIDSVTIFKNDKKIGEKKHHGYTGGKAKNNSYKIRVNDYETGAAYKIKAAIYGDVNSDSNGLVYIKRVR